MELLERHWGCFEAVKRSRHVHAQQRTESVPRENEAEHRTSCDEIAPQALKMIGISTDWPGGTTVVPGSSWITSHNRNWK